MWTWLVASVLLAFLVPARATAQPTRRVYVGVYLHDVTRLALRDGLYEVDVEMWAKWRGALDPARIQLANAAEVDRAFLGEESDGDWHTARWRVRGTLRGEFPLHRFPFDSQRVGVVVELPAREGRLVPDLASSGMAERFSLTDWLYAPEFSPRVGTRTVTSDLGVLATEGESTKIHRVAYEVVLERPIVTVALKLFLPLVIIALVAMVALLLHPELIEPRSSIGITALLSCFAFQFTVADSLPAVSYLTMADTLFLVAYVLSSVALAESILAHSLHRMGRARAALWLDRSMRVLLPVAVSAAVVWAMPPPAEVATVAPDPLPETPREESARDVLRIGTTLLTSALASPIDRASTWGLTPEDSSGEPMALFAERIPGVDNEALRFLASGALEVTWRVREGVRWSDGAPLVAADLLLPYEAMDVEHLVAFEAPDDRTLVLRWDAALAEALDGPEPWPAHVLRPVLDEGGYEALRDRRRGEPTPVLGPYRTVSFTAKALHVGEANPAFPGRPPAIRRVEVRYFDDREALIEAFLAGEVDVTFPNSVTLEQAARVGELAPGTAHVRPSSVLVVLNPDLAHPLLGQLHVRRALLMAIDRARIADELYGEAGRVAHVPVPGLASSAAVTPYDPARARVVLEEAGLRTLTLSADASPTTTQFVARVREDLEAVGVRVEVREIDSTNRTYGEHRHGGLLVYVLQGRRDATPQRYWNLPLVDGSYPEDQRHDAYTDEVHRMVERERHAMMPERRRQLREALIMKTAERLPNLPMVFAAERVLADPALHGWQVAPDQYFGTGLERWWFSLPAENTSRGGARQDESAAAQNADDSSDAR